MTLMKIYKWDYQNHNKQEKNKIELKGNFE